MIYFRYILDEAVINKFLFYGIDMNSDEKNKNYTLLHHTNYLKAFKLNINPSKRCHTPNKFNENRIFIA